MKKYKLSACGGTFDLFHKGHEDFLLSIFKVSEKIVIGITSDEFSAGKSTYEKSDARKKAVEEFILENKINAEIVMIDDIYGPTISERYSFDCLFVTEDSEKGAEKINDKREGLGLPPLKIIKIPLFKTPDGKTLSSTRIKNGEVDRDGKRYIDFDFDFSLPENLREKLSQPFGKLVKNLELSTADKIIAVGDETVKSFVDKNVFPILSIIDLKNHRKKKYRDISDLGLDTTEILKAENPSGRITKDLIRSIKRGLEKPGSVVLVDGEEDLAVIPAVLAAPLGYRVYYGQPASRGQKAASQGGPGKGIVEILVTEEKKKEIRGLLSQFTRKVI